MFQLKYVSGAIPGKPNKRTRSPDDTNDRKKKYEEHRKDRQFNIKWQTGREWLKFDSETSSMTCQICIDHQRQNTISNLKIHNTFITGCSNMKISAVTDHEKCKSHLAAVEKNLAKSRTTSQIRQAEAGRALRKLKDAEIGRLRYLVRNVHAVIKGNRPLTDFNWLCELDKAKGLDLGDTYLNSQAALILTSNIADSEREKTINMLGNNFYGIMMDGSTDISGDEQEAIYIRFSNNGKVTERFLGIGSPESTRSVDLEQFVLQMLDSYKLDKAKLISLGSDGASNMTGVKAGLATLLKKNVNSELINVHCFAHRLELAFRDVLRKNKLYEKLMTLLIGLHYFYTKQYKNKKGLLNTMAAFKESNEKGFILPPKVTGTRWMAHLHRGILALIRTFPVYNAHLCTISHDNPKAEGLVKAMLSKDLVCFMLFLKDVLDPLMRLSLKLQRPQSTVSECSVWVEATINMLEDGKTRDSEQITDILSTGKYQGVDLRGHMPTMMYKEDVTNGFINALQERFNLNPVEKTVISSTKILHFANWPAPGSPEIQGFGDDDVRKVADHFKTSIVSVMPTFCLDELMAEWKMLKYIVYQKHGDELNTLSWSDIYDAAEFPTMMKIIDILHTIPPTSVSCETTFSHMKLIKTSRRTKMRSTTLNDLLVVKLESPAIGNYNPEAALNKWIDSSIMPRRPNYRRNKTGHTVVSTNTPNLDQEMNDISLNFPENEHEECQTDDDDSIETDIHEFNLIYKYDCPNDDFCDGFLGEEETWSSLFSFSRD